MENYQNKNLISCFSGGTKKKLQEINSVFQNMYEVQRQKFLALINKESLEGKITEEQKSVLERSIETYQEGIKVSLAYLGFGNLDMIFPPLTFITIPARTFYNLTQTIIAYAKNDEIKKKIYTPSSNIIVAIPFLGPLAPLFSISKQNPLFLKYFLKSIRYKNKKP